MKYIDPDGREGFEVTAYAKLTIGSQIGYNISELSKAELNLGSVEIASATASLGVDNYGVYPDGQVSAIGVDGVKWEQKVMVGAGIPIIGGAEISVNNSFAERNGKVSVDDKKSGVKIDTDLI